jgi:hypothetical protein
MPYLQQVFMARMGHRLCSLLFFVRSIPVHFPARRVWRSLERSLRDMSRTSEIDARKTRRHFSTAQQRGPGSTVGAGPRGADLPPHPLYEGPARIIVASGCNGRVREFFASMRNTLFASSENCSRK